jgi:hypothetical protein
MVTLRALLAAASVVLVSTTLSSHEVDVHVAITNRAIDYLVQVRPELSACAPVLKQHIGLGVIDEDAYYAPRLSYYPLGRFFFHFLPQLTDVPLTTVGDAVTDATCNSEEWGNAPRSCTATLTAPLFERSSGARSNEHVYSQLIADLRNAPGTDLHNRGLVRLGHYVHLLQDLTSPAHTRNDAHPHFSFETLGIERLGDPSLFEVVNAARGEADITMPTGPLLSWATNEDAFYQLRSFTATRFWSEKNTLIGSGPARIAVTTDGYALDHEGRRIAHRNSRTSIFTINDVVARAQFDELAPVAVVYTASMINQIVEREGVSLCPAPLRFQGVVTSNMTFSNQRICELGEYGTMQQTVVSNLTVIPSAQTYLGFPTSLSAMGPATETQVSTCPNQPPVRREIQFTHSFRLSRANDVSPPVYQHGFNVEFPGIYTLMTLLGETVSVQVLSNAPNISGSGSGVLTRQ